MKKTLTATEAAHELASNPDNGFSYCGALALIEWLEDLETETGVEMEFDPVALRCEFSEYDSADQCAKDYLTDAQYEDMMDGAEDEEECEELASDYLEENTAVIIFNGGIVIQDF